jgi:hypothetical protein
MLGGGLVTDDITEHVNLPLYCIDGGVVVEEALLPGSICHAKVGDSIG